MYVNVATFDNQDPLVFGPYQSVQAAMDASPEIYNFMTRHKIGDGHLDGVTVQRVVGPEDRP